MAEIKKFKCGLCKNKKNEEYIGTRHGLRKHLREEHRIRSEIANWGEKGLIQKWWITEEFK